MRVWAVWTRARALGVVAANAPRACARARSDSRACIPARLGVRSRTLVRERTHRSRALTPTQHTHARHERAQTHTHAHTRIHVRGREGGRERERESTSTHRALGAPCAGHPIPPSPRRAALGGAPYMGGPQGRRCRLSQDVQAILHAPHIPLQAAAWQQWPSLHIEPKQPLLMRRRLPAAATAEAMCAWCRKWLSLSPPLASPDPGLRYCTAAAQKSTYISACSRLTCLDKQQ